MSNPMKMWNAWYSLSLQATRVAWEAQSVVMLRCMQIAAESARGRQTEASRMVTEKVAALAEALVAAATAAIEGRSSQQITKKALGVYKSAFRAPPLRSLPRTRRTRQPPPVPRRKRTSSLRLSRRAPRRHRSSSMLPISLTPRRSRLSRTHKTSLRGRLGDYWP
jgi:hypothetical protein